MPKTEQKPIFVVTWCVVCYVVDEIFRSHSKCHYDVLLILMESGWEDAYGVMHKTSFKGTNSMMMRGLSTAYCTTVSQLRTNFQSNWQSHSNSFSNFKWRKRNKKRQTKKVTAAITYRHSIIIIIIIFIWYKYYDCVHSSSIASRRGSGMKPPRQERQKKVKKRNTRTGTDVTAFGRVQK